MSDSLRPHESQHAKPPCPSPTPGVHSDSHSLSQWCHPAISSSVVPFSSFPNPSQHQSLFQRVNSSHEVAKVLEVLTKGYFKLSSSVAKLYLMLIKNTSLLLMFLSEEDNLLQFASSTCWEKVFCHQIQSAGWVRALSPQGHTAALEKILCSQSHWHPTGKQVGWQQRDVRASVWLRGD